ncbi:conserved hypothetical protein [Tenacibaculum maritimum]|uniref:hypothetical protein n=1 Tax=Tenacibaculum maritimum TaxID=107401 RepID=UPI0012E6E753|nr:hypothetical protein [Tenacibaculum maritimum]CAA0194830.1 conserved hypothetical protein [Tenacibaculum maritimum]
MRKSSSICIKRTLFKLIYIIIILIGINKSIAQQKTKRQFDIPTFEKNKNDKDIYKYTLLDGYTYEESSGLSDNNYIRIKFKDRENFKHFFRYFPNGKLKIQGSYYENKFNSGLWNHYNIKGELIKQIDYDAPFTYSWEDITAYLAKHGVKDLKKQVIGISRWHHQEKATWTLEFNGIYNNTKGRFVITLNGKTGEVLEVKLFKGKKALGKTGTIADYQILYKKDA